MKIAQIDFCFWFFARNKIGLISLNVFDTLIKSVYKILKQLPKLLKYSHNAHNESVGTVLY